MTVTHDKVSFENIHVSHWRFFASILGPLILQARDEADIDERDRAHHWGACHIELRSLPEAARERFITVLAPKTDEVRFYAEEVDAYPGTMSSDAHLVYVTVLDKKYSFEAADFAVKKSAPREKWELVTTDLGKGGKTKHWVRS